MSELLGHIRSADALRCRAGLSSFHRPRSHDPEMISAFIGKHEARAAMRRREAEGVLHVGGGDLCFQKVVQDVASGRIEIISESPALESDFGNILNQCLSQSPPVFVRTNDALHLAAARLANAIEFVSADKHQRAAAAFLGFTVLPTIYPIPTS